METLRQLYCDYLAQYAQLRKARKFSDGLFGMPRSPEREHCHTQFAETMRSWLAQQAAAPEDPEAVLSYIYFAPQTEKTDKETYWMLLAIHGMTLELIKALSPAAAALLLARYEKAYPRRGCLPAQKQVLAALKKQAGC